ncbi:MAG TPA: DUF5984 family protein [Thermoanaerobaculia bacterium]|jgi:hypothetical protein|nr:DUF5984 family protein [Thermoanaerobaculia bacterium]
MALFEFELAAVEDITPWDQAGSQGLSWFALTDGLFRIPAGEQVLFRYSDEILSHWGTKTRNASYMIAALARDILGSVGPGAAPLPESIARLASDWELLARLRKESAAFKDDDAAEDLSYTAWRWLGERSPWTSYLVANPNISFVRIGDDVHIHWDNREKLVDGLPVWTARQGVHVLPVETFLAESRDFATRLLTAMDERIAGIEAGTMRPQVGVSVPSLRQQHETWRSEYASYFEEYEPDIPWDETEAALHTIAEKSGIRF